MTRTTPELAPPSPNFRATPAGGRLATAYDLACNRPHTRESGFEPVTLRSRGRDLTTRPPRPHGSFKKITQKSNLLAKCSDFLQELRLRVGVTWICTEIGDGNFAYLWQHNLHDSVGDLSSLQREEC
ncbi:hypothetical protein AVEN_52700-1 [Araneus ventricosus]|uniref:Uncharacterized protein n=1 Tax=Araneus ventricosus TaxID=182803 RepID=A0A4Y2EQL0_ARAVE|nr:hypothetical protein AVEN_52700-1 [Araneus ventricosus]